MSSLSNFQKLKELGKGSFSTVYKVFRKSDNKEYAMKVVKITQLSEKEKQNALNEIRILASIVDPNIIAYKEAFFDESIRCLCIIMEYADAGDLMQKINAKRLQKNYFSESQIWKSLIQLTKGLRTLHNLKILHRDLKCANVFQTSDGVLKLGDLNVSKITQKGLAITQAGTPYYCAPEVWKGNVYDKKCDIWSLGCVLYELASLKPPFQGTGMKDLFNRISKGEFERIPKCYSNELFDIIKRCLRLNPNERPTTDEILNYPFIREKFPEELTREKVFSKAQLLNTIKMPKNLHGLKEKLPKPNYQINNKSFEEEDEFDRNLRKRCPSESGLKEKAIDGLDIRGALKKNSPISMQKERALMEGRLQTPIEKIEKHIVHGVNQKNNIEKPPLQKYHNFEQNSNNHGNNRIQKVEQPLPTHQRYEKYEGLYNVNRANKVEQPLMMPRNEQKNIIQRQFSGREEPKYPKKEEKGMGLKNERPSSRREERREEYPISKKNAEIIIDRPISRDNRREEYPIKVKNADIKIEKPMSRQEIKNKLAINEKKQAPLNQISNKARPASQKEPRKIQEKDVVKNNVAKKRVEDVQRFAPPRTPAVNTPSHNKENVAHAKRYPGLENKPKRK